MERPHYLGSSDVLTWPRSGGPEQHFSRGIHCKWEEKDGLHETVIPVWWRREQFGAECPDNIGDCEQVRRWTLGWGKDVQIVREVSRFTEQKQAKTRQRTVVLFRRNPS